MIDRYTCKTCTHPSCHMAGQDGIACSSYKAPAHKSIDDATPDEWHAAARAIAGDPPAFTGEATGQNSFQILIEELGGAEGLEDHPLYEVFMAAIDQAMHGKGERHGGARTPFLEQPWRHYAELHGRGFLTGQAAKKLEEAASTREGLAFETEIFGAMVYLGMAVLHERSKV